LDCRFNHCSSFHVKPASLHPFGWSSICTSVWKNNQAKGKLFLFRDGRLNNVPSVRQKTSEEEEADGLLIVRQEGPLVGEERLLGDKRKPLSLGVLERGWKQLSKEQWKE
jgi:hypothetical protein